MFVFRHLRSWFTQPAAQHDPVVAVETEPAFEPKFVPTARRHTLPLPPEMFWQACEDYEKSPRPFPHESYTELSRYTGFGDFCFDSVEMRYEKFERENSKEPDDLEAGRRTQVKSGVIRQYVMEDLAELGHFPFLKLPLDVRERIYRWFAMPYNFNGERQFGIRIQRFDELNPYTEDYYSRQFDADFHVERDEDLQAADSVEAQAAIYYRKRHERRRRCILHPERIGDHFITLNLQSGPMGYNQTFESDEDQWSVEWKREIVVEGIRNLSNTNTQVRHELARVLSRKMYVECADFCYIHFINFLFDKPICSAGIKSLSFSVGADAKDPSCPEQDLPQLRELCQFVAFLLDLETLVVSMWIHPSNLAAMQKFKGSYRALTSLRNLRVSRNFRAITNLIYDSDIDPELYEDMKTRMLTIRSTWAKVMPYTLRDSEATTEKESYLQERKHLVVDFENHESTMVR